MQMLTSITEHIDMVMLTKNIVHTKRVSLDVLNVSSQVFNMPVIHVRFNKGRNMTESYLSMLKLFTHKRLLFIKIY